MNDSRDPSVPPRIGFSIGSTPARRIGSTVLAAALLVAGKVLSLKAGARLAAESIASGRAKAVQQPDGTWELEARLPKPGYYNIVSDFLPTGGAPQVIMRSLITADFTGDARSDEVQIEPDTIFEKTLNGITAIEFSGATDAGVGVRDGADSSRSPADTVAMNR